MKNKITTNVRKGGVHKADENERKAYHAKVKKEREENNKQEEERKEKNLKTKNT